MGGRLWSVCGRRFEGCHDFVIFGGRIKRGGGRTLYIIGFPPGREMVRCPALCEWVIDG